MRKVQVFACVHVQTAAIFLSLKFHRLQPTYVHNRIKALQRAFRTFLLCHCDVDDPVGPLAQVAKAAIDHSCTLIVAFSDLECSRYLELLKAYENKSAESLQARLEVEHSARCASMHRRLLGWSSCIQELRRWLQRASVHACADKIDEQAVIDACMHAGWQRC